MSYNETINFKVKMNEVTVVGATPAGTKTITENGEYDVYDYEKANVNVKTAPTLQSKTVVPSPQTQVVTADGGFDGLSQVSVSGDSDLASHNIVKGVEIFGVVGSHECSQETVVEQATPTITVSGNGLITASATQSAGKVAGGTKSATKQLPTQAAQTITPGTSNKTIASGRYLTGTQTIKGDPDLVADNIKKGVEIFGVTGTLETTVSGGGIVPSGTKTITTNGAHDVTDYATAQVNVPIPSGYVKPSGNKSITENGTHDVAGYANAVVNVPTSSGIDTSDATATAADIKEGQTAYVNGEKITGAMGYLTLNQAGTITPVYVGGNVGIQFSDLPYGYVYAGSAQRCYFTDKTMLGNATAADVAAGKTFTSANGVKVTGTGTIGGSGGSSGTCKVYLQQNLRAGTLKCAVAAQTSSGVILKTDISMTNGQDVDLASIFEADFVCGSLMTLYLAILYNGYRKPTTSGGAEGIGWYDGRFVVVKLPDTNGAEAYITLP